MKKFFTFLSVGVTALALSAVAVGQMKKARVAYGAPPKVEANGGMLSAKAQKGESSVWGGKYKQSDAALTGLQKARLQKMQEQSAMLRAGKPVAHAPVMKIREVGPAAVADGNARITLDVQMDWGDGTGWTGATARATSFSSTLTTTLMGKRSSIRRQAAAWLCASTLKATANLNTSSRPTQLLKAMARPADA